MEIKIKETGEIKELLLIDPATGIDWAMDLTATDDNITFDGESRVCDQDTFDWWNALIQEYQVADDRYYKLRQSLDEAARFELIRKVHLAEWHDIEYYPRVLSSILDEWAFEHE